MNRDSSDSNERESVRPQPKRRRRETIFCSHCDRLVPKSTSVLSHYREFYNPASSAGIAAYRLKASWSRPLIQVTVPRKPLYWNLAVKVKLFLLLLGLVLQHPGDVGGQLIAAPPTCPNDTIIFRCTVTGDNSGITIWRVGGSSECSLLHRTPGDTDTCGPGGVFTQSFNATDATSFSSTLRGTAATALDGTLVECFGPALPRDAGNMVGNSSLQIIGPPSVTLSCTDLSEDVDGAVNITVNWTLSGGESADFYLISIITNDPQPPYEGLLNITTADVTQHELAGFQAGYGYDITIRGVNCGSQEGSMNDSLRINPQVPATSMPNVCAEYDRMTGTLQTIESTWNEVDPLSVSADCTNGQDIRASYELSYNSSSGTSITTCVVNWTDCSNGVCHHELQDNTTDSRCQPPMRQFTSESVTMTVTARNIVGRSNPAASRSIRSMNFLEVVVDSTNPAETSVECMFEPGYTCTIDYGTDSSYTNLVYSDNSTTRDWVTIITLSQEIQRNTTYYFIVSAQSSSQCERVRGTFRTECTELDLSDFGNTTPEGMMDPRCERFGRSLLIPNGVVCYNRTTAMSEAVYICDDNSCRMSVCDDYEMIEATVICQNDGNWNGIIPQCMSPEPFPGWNPYLTGVGAISIVAAFSLTITGIVIFFIVAKILVPCLRLRRGSTCCTIVLIVLPFLSVIGIPLAIIMLYFEKVVKAGKAKGGGSPTSEGSLPSHEGNEDIDSGPPTPSHGGDTCCMIVTVVLLCLSVIGIPLVIAVWYFKDAKKGDESSVPSHSSGRIVADYKLILFFSLMTVAGVFLIIGVALWIAVAVVVSNPPNGDVFDLSFRDIRDQLIISGFVFSILALIYAMTIFWAVCLKCEKLPSGKCMVLMIVLLCVSVIGIPFFIIFYFLLLYFKNVGKDAKIPSTHRVTVDESSVTSRREGGGLHTKSAETVTSYTATHHSPEEFQMCQCKEEPYSEQPCSPANHPYLEQNTNQELKRSGQHGSSSNDRLTTEDLYILTSILKAAAPKWQTIGGALGFVNDDLTIMQRKPLLIPEGDTGYFREMLSQWLKWAPPNHDWPTITALEGAVRDSEHESLAYNFRERFLQKKGKRLQTPV